MKTTTILCKAIAIPISIAYTIMQSACCLPGDPDCDPNPPEQCGSQTARSVPPPGGLKATVTLTIDLATGNREFAAAALPSQFGLTSCVDGLEVSVFRELGPDGSVRCPQENADDQFVIVDGCLTDTPEDFDTVSGVVLPDQGPCGEGAFPLGPAGVGDTGSGSGCVAIEVDTCLACSQGRGIWTSFASSTWRLQALDDLEGIPVHDPCGVGETVASIPSGTVAEVLISGDFTWESGDFECDDPGVISGEACCFNNDCEELPAVICRLSRGVAQGPGTTCPANCVYCGNGVVDADEECDPPDLVTCNDDCEMIVCGDGRKEGDEECDPPNESRCTADCTLRQFAECENAYGDCFAGQDVPGCEIQDTCNRVCREMPACCESAWDESCAELAADTEVQACCIGGTSFTCTNATAWSCRLTNAEPLGPGTTCDDSPCAAALTPDCIDADGSCLEVHGGRACDNITICHSVCMDDASCCEDAWDQRCVDLANDLPQACCFSMLWNSGCTVNTEQFCQELGGSAMGPGTTCETAVCPE